VSSALALRLIAHGAVSASDAEAALLASLSRRIPFVRALVDTGAIGEALLDAELEQLGGIGLRQVAGMPELVNRLPPHFCRRMGVLPLRVDHPARVVEVAAADPLDPHIAAEVAFHLGVPVRVLRAPISAIEDAIRRIELEAEAAAGRSRRATPPFPHGAPDSSNPPPPPALDPPPIPLLKRIGPDKPPDTLRLYKQTLRPDAPGAELDFNDTRPAAKTPLTPAPAAPNSEPTPVPLRASKLWDIADAEPDTLALASDAEASHADAEVASERAPRSLRTTAAPEPAPRPAPSEPPLSAMVPGTPTAPGPARDQPSVSFPSLPPPSILDQPALLPADEVWSGPVPSADPKPEPAAPARQRRASRFARPSIDIQLPQPPSESRARRQRSSWDMPLADGEVRDQGAMVMPPDEPDVMARPSRGPLLTRYEMLDAAPALESLRTAASRDEVVVAALRGLRTIGRRVAIFVVRRDGFHGWACNVELGDQDQLREVAVLHDAPSLFATSVAAGTYFGPVPANAVHASLLAVLEQPASDVAVSAARAGGRPAMVLFADDLVDIKRRVLPRLIELTDAVGAALSRLLAARL